MITLSRVHSFPTNEEVAIARESSRFQNRQLLLRHAESPLVSSKQPNGCFWPGGACRNWQDPARSGHGQREET